VPACWPLPSPSTAISPRRNTGHRALDDPRMDAEHADSEEPVARTSLFRRPALRPRPTLAAGHLDNPRMDAEHADSEERRENKSSEPPCFAAPGPHWPQGTWTIRGWTRSHADSAEPGARTSLFRRLALRPPTHTGHRALGQSADGRGARGLGGTRRENKPLQTPCSAAPDPHWPGGAFVGREGDAVGTSQFIGDERQSPSRSM
jgi:hypothetical protein